jgi:hypothetical protein
VMVVQPHHPCSRPQPTCFCISPACIYVPGYRPCGSARPLSTSHPPTPCRRHWFRVPTEYDGESGVLSWTHTPERGACYYAYFAPFSYEQHQDLVAEMQCHDNVTLEMLVR